MSLLILGADAGKAVLVRVKNPLDLASDQGGWKGAVASWAVPKMTTGIVLDQMAAQFKKSLADKGVIADVAVVEDVGAAPVKGSTDILTGAVLGVGLVGAGWATWHYGIRKLFGG